METRVKLSLIICTYNRCKYIYRTLEKIACNDFPYDRYEVVLVNNKSTDATAEECTRFNRDYPQVDFRYFVELQQGLSYARNRGIAESRGEVLIFLDDDAFVCPDYLQKMQRYLEQYPEMRAFGGKIDPYYESGVAPEWMSKWSYSWVSALDKGKKVCTFKNKEFPIGANMGMYRALMDECGGFNTNLGRTGSNLMGGEEKDLFNRLRAFGYALFYLPEISVEHCIPASRLTRDFIGRLATGVGKSERIRTQNISREAFYKRCFSEMIKWGGTCVLWVAFLLKACVGKGNILFFFRYRVTRGLLGK
ncbi:MAG: glycosyltransferase [Bacteroides sp.]|nr:glycosyltransferase [Ruminococcus flavefaciens]MCM1554538.1 glycosyltransferase [Bacteroides sp.]